MKTATLVSAALLLVTFAGTARAGAFVGLGIGSQSNLEEDSPEAGAQRFGPNGRSGRLMAGYSLPLATGRIAAEGAYTGFDASHLKASGVEYSASVLWLAGRYNYPLSDGFEAFGRIGYSRTSLTSDDVRFDAEGSGPVLSLGFEFRPAFKLGVDLSVWVDVTYIRASLEGERIASSDASNHFYTLGVTAGF